MEQFVLMLVVGALQKLLYKERDKWIARFTKKYPQYFRDGALHVEPDQVFDFFGAALKALLAVVQGD